MSASRVMMMIVRLTGVSQAGRRRCCGAGAPPWDPSAEVLASVSLTAGVSLNLSLFSPVDSPFGDLGRRHSRRVRGRRPIARPKADRTGQDRHNGRLLRNSQVKPCGKNSNAWSSDLRNRPAGTPWEGAGGHLAGPAPGSWRLAIAAKDCGHMVADLADRHADPAAFRGPGTPCAGTVTFAAASCVRSVPRGDSHGNAGLT